MINLNIVAQASWNCSACFVECAETDAKCPACGTAKASDGSSAAAAKPAADGGGGGASAAVTQPPKKGSIWDKTAKKASGWNCSACFVECEEKAAKCPACGTAKPGGDSSATAASSSSSKPTISFGTKQSNAGDAGKPKFSFGTTAKGAGSEGSGAKPKFGSNATASFGTKK